MNQLTALFIAGVLLCSNDNAICQILTATELPIVIINTGGNSIPDDPKINATMGIIFNGQEVINNINDVPNYYYGNIGIETRGNSTQDFDKKTYSVELRTSENQDTSVNLFGMGADEDWILHAMVIDKSQIRIPMSFYLAQQMGHYASDWKYVEVIINDEYRGLYILTEKIKRDDDRVDIAKLDSDDIEGDSLTGGYILRIDWLEDFQNGDGFTSTYDSQGGIPMTYQWYYPKANKIQQQQANYIENWMENFEDALFAPNYTNSAGIRYNEYIDLNSFVDFVVINELSKNSDGYKLSSYVYKDKDSKGGKLTAGPIWDFDQSYGVSDVCSCNDFTEWTYLQNQEGCEDLESMPLWWQAMMEDPVFRNKLKCRWAELRTNLLNKDTINEWIDVQTNVISDAIDRNFTKWDEQIGEYIWAEPDPVPESYEEELIYLKDWISNRIDWIDTNIPGDCSLSSTTQLYNNVVTVSPNPVHNKLIIKCKDFVAAELYGFDGKTIATISMKELNLTNYASGIYFLKITTKEEIVIKKIIKR